MGLKAAIKRVSEKLEVKEKVGKTVKADEKKARDDVKDEAKKLGLPDGAIRQKMMKDNVDETSMAIFFGEATVRREAPDSVPKIDMSMLRAQQTARREEMKDEGKSGLMSKYFKMQSMGIPMGAIRQKMKNDAVAVQDIAAFCGDLPSGPPPKGGPSNAQMKSNKARSKLKQLHWKKLDSVRARNDRSPPVPSRRHAGSWIK